MSGLDKSFHKAIAASKKKTTIELGDEILKVRNRLSALYRDWKAGKYETTKSGYSGDTERTLDGMAEVAAQFAVEIGPAGHHGPTVSKRIKAVRKALGYTSP